MTTIRHHIAALLRAVPNPFKWAADKLDPPQPDRLGGAGPFRPE